MQGRPLQLPMGWGVGEELTKSWPTFEQLCVQNLALAISYCFSPTKIGKIQRVETQRAKTSENFAEEQMFAEDISEDFSDLAFTGIYSISGYLRNLRGRLLSSEKFSEVLPSGFLPLSRFQQKLVQNSGWLEVDQELDNGWPTFDTNISVLKLQGSFLQ